MERGDIIVAYQDRQRFLVQVQDVASNTIHGFLAKDYHIPYRRTPIELVAKDVVVNLGKRPHPGSVYGLEVAHHAVTKHHDDFGQVSFLYYVRKEVGAKFGAERLLFFPVGEVVAFTTPPDDRVDDPGDHLA